MNKKNVFKQFNFQKISDNTDRICEKDDCQEIGKFKAPISRNADNLLDIYSRKNKSIK